MPPPAPIIELNNVSLSYDGVLVLDNISLRIMPGEFVSIVGPSGCGKSTLLRLLVGAESPVSGAVSIAGRLEAKPSSACGIVYQKYSVFPHFTVLQNIAFGLAAKSGSPGARAQYSSAEEYLCRVGLEAARHKYPYQLSGGMEQRVAIAQALVTRPPVLLLDEPFSALDSWRREQLQLFLLELYEQEHMTVLFVTHDLKEAVYLGSRVLVMGSLPGHTATGGTTITLDIPIIAPRPRLPSFKTSAEFNRLLEKIHQKTFGSFV